MNITTNRRTATTSPRSRLKMLAVAGLVWAGVLAGVCVFPVATAFGGVGHEYRSQITGFAKPWGLAFDAGGSLYVDNTLASVGEVDVFNAIGEEQPQIGLGTLVEGRTLNPKYVRNMAVDRATGDVYVADSGPDGVYVFRPLGAGVYENISLWRGNNTQAKSFGGGYVSVAIDNNPSSPSDPHAGDVYVESSSNGTVDILRPNPVGPKEAEEGASEGELASPGGFSFTENVGLAVDATGKVYVPNKGDNLADEFDGSGESLGALNGSETPAKAIGDPIAVGVDESTQELYVVDKSNRVVDQFNATGKYLAKIKGELKEPLGVAVQSLAGPSKGEVYVTDGEAGAVDIFGPDVVKPEPVTSTGAAKEETTTTATVTGKVNPEGLPTEYWFQYGPTEAYGSETRHEPAGEGTTEVEAKAGLEALEPHKAYHYRLVAENAFGSAAGSDQTFTTQQLPPDPSASTGSASQVTQSTATLSGSVTPGSFGPNSDTTWSFQYGIDTSYSAGSVPVRPDDAGMGTSPVAVSTILGGLAPNTTYHYRLVASNANADPPADPQVADGIDKTFTTPASEPLLDQPSELTETGVRLNGDVNPGGHDLHYSFQYGPSTAYGESTPLTDACEGTTPPPACGGSTPTPIAVSVSLSNLTPNVVYHYRLVAGGSGPESDSPDSTFTLYAPVPQQTGNPFSPGQSTPIPFPTVPLLNPPPPPPRSKETKTGSKPLTRSQKREKALEKCTKDKSKKQRVACEEKVNRKYTSRPKPKTKTK